MTQNINVKDLPEFELELPDLEPLELPEFGIALPEFAELKEAFQAMPDAKRDPTQHNATGQRVRDRSQ